MKHYGKNCMMKIEKVTNILSMAQRAGCVSSGDFIAERMLKKGQVALVILAVDTAENNEEKYRFLCQTYNVPFRKIFTKEELGKTIGKEFRAIVTINDRGFAKALLKILDDGGM